MLAPPWVLVRTVAAAFNSLEAGCVRPHTHILEWPKAR